MRPLKFLSEFLASLSRFFYRFKRNFKKYFFNRLPDVIAVRICFPAESYGAVAMEKLLEERAARQPHPHAGVDGPIGV